MFIPVPFLALAALIVVVALAVFASLLARERKKYKAAAQLSARLADANSNAQVCIRAWLKSERKHADKALSADASLAKPKLDYVSYAAPIDPSDWSKGHIDGYEEVVLSAPDPQDAEDDLNKDLHYAENVNEAIDILSSSIPKILLRIAGYEKNKSLYRYPDDFIEKAEQLKQKYSPNFSNGPFVVCLNERLQAETRQFMLARRKKQP